MGIALSRHKRSDYFVATKLSNFAPETQTREASIQMYRNSLKELQVDYIDYYLLHSIGGGGMEAFSAEQKGHGSPWPENKKIGTTSDELVTRKDFLQIIHMGSCQGG